MVRRRYRLTQRYSQQLVKKLKNLGLKPKKKQIEQVLSDYINKLLPYIYRTRIKKDLGKNSKDLSEEEKVELKRRFVKEGTQAYLKIVGS